MAEMTQKEWEAQDNARTLAEAKAIEADPVKLKAAQVAAGKLIEENQRRMDGLKKVAQGNKSAAKPTLVTQSKQQSSRHVPAQVTNTFVQRKAGKK